MPFLRHPRAWTILIATGLLSTPACTTNQPAPTVAPPVSSGVTASDATFLDPQGRKYRLSDLKGNAILLVEWAYWCPHCQAELPKIQNDLLPALGNRGVAVVCVEASGGKAADVTDFATKYGVTMPLFLDDAKSITTAYPTQGFPTIHRITPDFRLAGTRSGEIGMDVLLADLKPYLR